MAETMQSRSASISRKTNETSISVSVNIDGTGASRISTGVGFLTICWNSCRVIR